MVLVFIVQRFVDPTAARLETVDEGLGVGLTEFGGTLQHDRCLGEGHGGAAVGKGRVLRTEVCGSAGDVQAIGIIVLIRERSVIKERIGVVKEGFAYLNGTRGVLRRRLFRTARARA